MASLKYYKSLDGIRKRLDDKQQALFCLEIPKHLKKNDEFYTPIPLAIECIRFVDLKPGDVVLDSAYGTGNFYNNYPTFTKNLYTEDFLTFHEKIDWIITNPPYSKINEYLEHSCKICKKGFAYLLLAHHLTIERIMRLEKNGFYIEKILLSKVDKWYGYNFFIVFRKGLNKGLLSYIYGRY